MTAVETALNRLLGFALSRKSDNSYAILFIYTTPEECDQHLETILRQFSSGQVAIHLDETGPGKCRISLIDTESGDIHASNPGIPIIKSAILKTMAEYDGPYALSSGFFDSELKQFLIPKGNTTEFTFSSFDITELSSDETVS